MLVYCNEDESKTKRCTKETEASGLSHSLGIKIRLSNTF